jgi:hypothetical protein
MSLITIAACLVVAAISVPFLGLLVCAAAPLIGTATHLAEREGRCHAPPSATGTEPSTTRRMSSAVR